MMTIGVCGPIDLKLLDWELKGQDFPETNSFPLSTHFVNALLRRGFKVVAYTNSPFIEEPMVLEGKHLTVCIAPQRPQPGRRFFQFEVKELQKQIQQHPCDFISAFWSYEYGWAALRSGIPTVVSLHDVALQILLQHKDIFRLVRWAINYIVVSKATHLIANSSYTYNMLDKGTREKTIVINNFYPAELEEQLEVPIQKQDYLVSVSMGFSNRKNISTALQAFAIIRKQYPKLEYHLLGAGMEPGGPAQQYALENDLADGVKFIGTQPYDKVLHEISHARILLHPAREESFGMVLLEAMIARTPVIGGKESGYVPTLLDNGKAGLLCDINSPEAIADSIDKLMQNRQLAKDLVQNAYEFARNNYSEEVIIDQHLRYYAKILGKRLIPAQDIETTETSNNIMRA
ncbi:glycosyltransferase involved in cell wall biosynthesis [Pontibacter aydingkolensis]|uniref:Glycosyltransferase family 4 protein n=1 Tax=Pontibacter aydingkolensis TaxID=1911536 RepID=A0ABS7CS87_9BACT|nr:glycosyltransferase family 4 protein [Pontibacter aydingkolensis]MBW7466719.1 glycosyltransferase family 4 protein [Pontibacter aydingkolensis]